LSFINLPQEKILTEFKEIFLVFFSLLPQSLLNDFEIGLGESPEKCLEKIVEKTKVLNLLSYYADLARLEYAVHQLRIHEEVQRTDTITEIIVNPELHLIKSGWSGLAVIFEGQG
jgi:hypothetical protein